MCIFSRLFKICTEHTTATAIATAIVAAACVLRILWYVFILALFKVRSVFSLWFSFLLFPHFLRRFPFSPQRHVQRTLPWVVNTYSANCCWWHWNGSSAHTRSLKWVTSPRRKLEWLIGVVQGPRLANKKSLYMCICAVSCSHTGDNQKTDTHSSERHRNAIEAKFTSTGRP